MQINEWKETNILMILVTDGKEGNTGERTIGFSKGEKQLVYFEKHVN